MLALRVLLCLMLVVVGAYTAVVIGRHGLDLFSVFFGDMARMGWAGQFNLDFMGMLRIPLIADTHSRLIADSVPGDRGHPERGA